MKKIILTVAALTAFGTASAQDLKFGVKAGLNLANLTSDYDGDEFGTTDNKMKAGFHIGGLVEIKFNEKWALQPEVLYSTQGTNVDVNYFDDEEGSIDYKTNLSYINVPVMVKFYPIPKLFVEAGPQVGFLMSAKEKYDDDVFISDDSDEMDDEIDVKDYYKSIDFGFNIGAGYEFTDMIYANLRYNIGLTDISDMPDEFDDVDFGVFGDAFKTKNQVLSLSVGFKF